MIPNITVIIALYASARLIEMPLKDNKSILVRVLLGIIAVIVIWAIWSITRSTLHAAASGSLNSGGFP